MSYFEFPNTREYNGDLGWIIKKVEELNEAYNNFFDLNKITFHDPIEWNINESYKANTIVYDNQSATLYISRDSVPAGIDISNTDYWVVVSPFKIDTALSATSLNPVANRVITEEVNNIDDKIDSVDNALNNKINAETENRISEDNGIRTAITNESSARHQADTSLSNRIDEIVSSATVDSEVIDIRTNAEGITYASAGSAVRALEQDINAIQNFKFISGDYVRFSDGSIQHGDTTRSRTDYLICPAGVSITYSGETNHANVAGISFYDINKRYLGGYANNESTPGDPVTVTSPDNTKYCIISTLNAVKNKFVYEISGSSAVAVIADDTFDLIKKANHVLTFIGNGTNRSNSIYITNEKLIAVTDSDYQLALWYGDNQNTGWQSTINIGNYADPEFIQFRKSDNSNIPAGYYDVASVYYDDSIVTYSDLDKELKNPVFVDGVNGSDSNSGLTRSDSFKTINHALTAGYKTIYVKPGTYAEVISISNTNDITIVCDMYYANFVNPGDTDNPVVIINASNNNNGISLSSCNNVILKDIKVMYATKNGFIFDKCNNVKLDTCTADLINEMGFKMDDTNAEFVNCIASNIGIMGGGQHHDGFNINKTGTCNFINCSAYNCEDDGISHHDACIGYISGGEFYNCGKGGIASPAHGAKVDVTGVYSHDNAFGLYAGNDHPELAKTFNVSNCAFKDNTTYDIYVKNNTANIFNCIYDTINASGSNVIT